MYFRTCLVVSFLWTGTLVYANDVAPEKTFICVEGCMGAGKSTLVRLLAEKFDWMHPVYEPVKKWQNVGDRGDNLLDIFFQDQERWTFTLGMYVVLTRTNELEEKQALPAGEIYLADGSIYTDRYCYAKASYQLGYTTSFEWHIYKEWLSWMMRTCPVRPKGFIYIQGDTPTSLARIMQRARTEEAEFPIDKIRALHQCYNDLLYHRCVGGELADVPILVLDGTKDFEHNQAARDDYLQRVEAFVKQLV